MVWSLFKYKAHAVYQDTTDDWLVGNKTRMDRVLDTDTLIQLQVYPYIHNVRWIGIGGGVYEQSSSDSVHIRLTTTYIAAPAKNLLNPDKNYMAPTSLFPTP